MKKIVPIGIGSVSSLDKGVSPASFIEGELALVSLKKCQRGNTPSEERQQQEFDARRREYAMNGYELKRGALAGDSDGESEPDSMYDRVKRRREGDMKV